MRKHQRTGFPTILFLLVAAVLSLFLLGPAVGAEWPQMASSKDGVGISYEVSGNGEPVLVFVHGWSCDGRYWRKQVPYFSQKHRVIVLDLAGHGHSGLARSQYTMKAFGEDVKAVVQATNSKRVILIGHSMGGAVIAEAARLMPDRVIGLIGVDTLDNIEYQLTREELSQTLDPLIRDFQGAGRQFVREMIYDDTDPALRRWILADISTAPPPVALSAMKEMLVQYITGEAAAVFEEIQTPVMAVNGDLWPIDYEANRKHMASFDAIVLEKADHFLMLDEPKRFNNALAEAVGRILDKEAGGAAK